MLKLSLGDFEAIINKDLTIEGDEELVNILNIFDLELKDNETTSEITIIDETNRDLDNIITALKDTMEVLEDEDYNLIIVSNNESISFQMYDSLGLKSPDVMKYENTVVFKIIDKQIPNYNEFKKKDFQFNDGVVVFEYNI